MTVLHLPDWEHISRPVVSHNASAPTAYPSPDVSSCALADDLA